MHPIEPTSREAIAINHIREPTKSMTRCRNDKKKYTKKIKKGNLANVDKRINIKKGAPFINIWSNKMKRRYRQFKKDSRKYKYKTYK